MKQQVNKVYKLINVTNENIYIGITVGTLKKRLTVHRAHAKSCINSTNINKAIREFGAQNFCIELLEECKSLEEAIERENFWISFYDSMNKGYNMKSSGQKNECSEELKRKIGDGNRGKKLSVETRLKIGQSNRGKNPNKARPMTDFKKAQLYLSNKGRKQSPEHIEKVRARLLTYYKNGGWHPSRGKKLSPERIAQQAAFCRKYSIEELISLATRWHAGEKIKDMLKDFPAAKDINSLRGALLRGKKLLKNKQSK